MVAKTPYDRPDLANLMPRIIKPLRQLRRLSSDEMARAMNIAPRTYEDFENGRTKFLNHDRVFAFARILNLDPHAIFTALEMRTPEFALHCAANKLMMVHLTAVEDFYGEVQEAVMTLDALTLMEAYAAFYAQLGELARKRKAAADRWRPPPGDRASGGSEHDPE